MKKNFTIKLVILFLFSFFFCRVVSAASLELNTDNNVFDQGKIFTVSILLNTEGQSVNTIEGDINYDNNVIQAEAIDTGGSFVNFWVEKPDMKTVGFIHFSGVTPGGVSVLTGEVFKVIFRAKKTGDMNIYLNNVTLYLNDGKGSTIPAKIKNLSMIVKSTQDSEANTKVVFDDKIPPEKFNIIRTKDASLFDNKYFIVFSTVDKGSGVDHYQVCELFKCILADSPFLLKNQTPFYYIKVNAYDINGNHVSTVVVSFWFILIVVLLLLIVIILIFYFFRRYFNFNKV